jgi:hypothetical protein
MFDYFGLNEMRGKKTAKEHKTLNQEGKHNRSLKVVVQGPDFMAHPLYIHATQTRGCQNNRTALKVTLTLTINATKPFKIFFKYSKETN